MAARCGQEVAWHERMGGLPKEDLVEELLECMTHLCDQVERKPSGVIHNGWYQQLVADEVEVHAVVRAEVARKHLLVVVGRESSE